MTIFEYLQSCDLQKLAGWLCLVQQLSICGEIRSQDEWEQFLQNDIDNI